MKFCRDSYKIFLWEVCDMHEKCNVLTIGSFLANCPDDGFKPYVILLL